MASSLRIVGQRAPLLETSTAVHQWHRRYLVAWVASASCAAVLYVVLAARVLPWWMGTLLAAALVALVPTAPFLARRVALNLALLLGWSPVLWWVEWPFAVNHAALLTAVVTGGLVTHLLVRSTEKARRPRLLPSLRPSDLLLLGAGVAALLATQKWALLRSPQRALEVMLPGADNYAHFNMFSTLLARGATLDALRTSPDGSGWAFDNYPQSFHAWAATIAELTSSQLPQGPEVLVAYTHAVSVVVVLGAVLLVASVLSLPKLGERPGIALPVAALVLTAFVWEPGQKVLANGFAGFWLGAVAVSCALLLSMSPGRSRGALDTVVVGGLLVCAAHTWTPLVLIGGPAAVAILIPRPVSGTDRERRHRTVLCVLLLGVSALVAVKAVYVLMKTVKVSFIVSEVSGFAASSPIPTLLLIVASVFLFQGFPSWVLLKNIQNSDLSALVARVRLLSLAPLLGVVSLVILYVAQMRSLGTTSYYFFKYLLGFELILAALVPGLLGVLLALTTRPMWHRLGVPVASLLLAAAATQSFGHLKIDKALLLSETDAGTAAIGPRYSRTDMARGVLAATSGTTSAQSFQRDYLPLGKGNAAEAFYPDGWYHAINASVTVEVFDRYSILRRRIETVGQAAPLVRRMLTDQPDLELVVAPDFVEPLRAAVASPGIESRVVGWSDDRSR